MIGYESGLLQTKSDGTHMLDYWVEQVRENPDSKLEHIQRAVLANLMHYDKGGADALTVLLGWDHRRTLPYITRPSLHLIGSRDCIKPPVFESVVKAASGTSCEIIRYKVIYGAGIMGWLDYPQEYAAAILEFLDDPEAYVGTTGHELDLAMKEYLFPKPEEATFVDYNRYPDAE